MNSHQLDVLADVYAWLIEWAANKEADGGEFGDLTPSAVETDLEPAHNHYARRANDKQAEA